MVSGLRDYFNAGLGTLLLYRLERVQYREVLESEKNVQVADVYGAEHLLRLFGMSTDHLYTARYPQGGNCLGMSVFHNSHLREYSSVHGTISNCIYMFAAPLSPPLPSPHYLQSSCQRASRTLR